MMLLALQTMSLLALSLSEVMARPTSLLSFNFGSSKNELAFNFGFGSRTKEWVWIQVPGTQCSDGSTTGFAISTFGKSTDLVIGFQGGGVCWDYHSCYVQNTSVNMGVPYNGTTFVQHGMPWILNTYGPMMRDNSANPFYQANYAFVPYCTGDLHAGNATVTYSPNVDPTLHHGYLNGKLILQAIQAALPHVERIWMDGSSAGGFGAIFQYPNAISVFGKEKRIDLIADSSEYSGSAYFWPSLNMQVISTSLCPACDASRFDSYLPALAAIRPNSRFAAMSFANDTILPAYLGTSFEDMSAEIVNSFTALNKANNAKGFIVPGFGHVILTTPALTSINGMSVASFLTDMVSNPNWTAGM